MKYIIESMCLTPRQAQVVTILLHEPQVRNKEIAQRLNLSERTVKFHITGIMDLCGCRKREALVDYYSRYRF